MSPLLRDDFAQEARDDVIENLAGRIEEELMRVDLQRTELRGLMGYVEALQAVAAHCGPGPLAKARVAEWTKRILEVFDADTREGTDFTRQWRADIVDCLVRLKNFAAR